MVQRAQKSSTSTSSFGVGRRESHDSSGFYARFTAPEVSNDDAITPWIPSDPFICGDASDMRDIPDNSVALVVTSPPYFVGKEYEKALGEGHIPSTYIEYLGMLYRVFKECKRVLEPGGRIAVNVANLGRKPYRSLSADVMQILENELRFLLRGEVIWKKADGASGSCAWGSFRQAANPVLRDITERVVIASKGRFDRAVSIKERQKRNLPYQTEPMPVDEFMQATLDFWEIPAESATRVGHPAPFPVELPERLIQLYTFRGDLVLDPFMGSGTTLVAAAKRQRYYIGYDTDQTYVEIAKQRVERVRRERAAALHDAEGFENLVSPTGRMDGLLAPDNEDFQARASREGKAAQGIARKVLEDSGFKIVAENQSMRGLGIVINFMALDNKGKKWYFDVSGAFTTPRAGLLRTDTLWKALGRTLVLKKDKLAEESRRVILLTTHLPQPKSAGDIALHAVGWQTVFDAIEMLRTSGQKRLKLYATGKYDKPEVGFWTADELFAKDRDSST